MLIDILFIMSVNFYSGLFYFREEKWMNKDTLHLKCPWCEKGEILANGRAKVIISAQCPKCHKFFVGDLYTLRTEKSKACRRAG